MSEKPFYAFRPLMGEMKFSTERRDDALVTKVTWPVEGCELVRVAPKPPTIVTYYGRDIQELSRDELLSALTNLLAERDGLRKLAFSAPLHEREPPGHAAG